MKRLLLYLLCFQLFNINICISQEAPKRENSVKCMSLTNDGIACKNMTYCYNDLCVNHGGDCYKNESENTNSDWYEISRKSGSSNSTGSTVDWSKVDFGTSNLQKGRDLYYERAGCKNKGGCWKFETQECEYPTLLPSSTKILYDLKDNLLKYSNLVIIPTGINPKTTTGLVYQQLIDYSQFSLISKYKVPKKYRKKNTKNKIQRYKSKHHDNQKGYLYLYIDIQKIDCLDREQTIIIKDSYGNKLYNAIHINVSYYDILKILFN
jgi:hypothetical protein